MVEETAVNGECLHQKDDQIYDKAVNPCMMITQQDFLPSIGNIINIERFGSLKKLLMVTSYVLRFINNCGSKEKISGEIVLDEINQARHMWIKQQQDIILNDEKYLNKLKYSLGAYTDENGLLRVKGRLEYADLDCKTPILLPSKQYFTKLIIKDAHGKVMHSGMKDTLTELRAKYWVIQGRARVGQIVNSCFLCRKYGCRLFKKVPAAPLPDFRAQLSHPFANTGVDYLGPLFVYATPGGNKEMRFKVHVVLFTCASTRAVHLDLVPDAGSPAFNRCVKRFISRRGIPTLFISDNAKCFMGPDVKKFLRDINCNWKFILERSPWWGGFWERLVQMVKRILRKVLRKSVISYDELLTVITEAEGVINSRPLCYEYSDDVIETLTPSHLMHGRRLKTESQYEEIREETGVTLTRRVRHLEKVIDHFQKRWKHEYLTELREHQSCNASTPTKQVKVGDVVLIEDKRLPRSRWRLGLISHLFVSKDGYVRGCKLKVHDGKNGYIYLQRPINQLCFFEVTHGLLYTV